MSADTTRGSTNKSPERPAASEVVRWLLALLFGVLALALVAVFAAGLFAFRFWTENRTAAKAVEKEVARLRRAGEPMTVEDLYRFQSIPENVADTTPVWLAAQTSCNPSRLNQDGKSLPIVGNGNAASLRPEAVDSQLAAAEEFLTQNSPALDAILAAAQKPGECRYPVKFEQGISLVANDVQGVRTMVRLLALNIQVKAIRDQSVEALASLEAMFAASDTISHQITLVEQLVRLATLGSALGQTEFLLSEGQLSDEQLASLARQVAACDLQGSFTRSLIGERALGLHVFQEHFGQWRSADCLKYLEVLTKLIAFSAEPLPDGRTHMQAMLAQFQAKEAAASAWNKHLLTALNEPAFRSAFDSYSKATAYHRAILGAIAAERYRIKSGCFPSQIAELTPDYLPSIPLDPFDGQPLRLRRAGDDILIYSVGLDSKDDGATNPPGNSREPDIVVRVSSVKTH